MDFLKKVLLITLAYFLFVLLWILYTEEQMHLFLLGLQAVTFGIIVAGFLFFSKEKINYSCTTNFFKDDDED